MKIAIVGAGKVGSAFAYTLARAEHTVTVIARGARLQQLKTDGGVVTVGGERADLEVAEALDPTIEWDLVLVTVLATQVDAVLPSLRACKAKTVIFMFNTFEPLHPLRGAVGAERFAFGFPSIMAFLIDGKLKHDFISTGQITTVSRPEVAELFNAVGIKTVVHADMHAWLRTHAAFVIPLMSIGVVVYERGAGLTWGEAAKYARAWTAGFDLVRKLGHQVAPASMVPLSRLPAFLVTPLLWMMSRTKLARDTGELGPAEARMLIDQARAAAPRDTDDLVAIRP